VVATSVATAYQYMAIVLPGRMFKEAYRKRAGSHRTVAHHRRLRDTDLGDDPPVPAEAAHDRRERRAEQRRELDRRVVDDPGLGERTEKHAGQDQQDVARVFAENRETNNREDRADDGTIHVTADTHYIWRGDRAAQPHV